MNNKKVVNDNIKTSTTTAPQIGSPKYVSTNAVPSSDDQGLIASKKLSD